MSTRDRPASGPARAHLTPSPAAGRTAAAATGGRR